MSKIPSIPVVWKEIVKLRLSADNEDEDVLFVCK